MALKNMIYFGDSEIFFFFLNMFYSLKFWLFKTKQT